MLTLIKATKYGSKSVIGEYRRIFYIFIFINLFTARVFLERASPEFKEVVLLLLFKIMFIKSKAN